MEPTMSGGPDLRAEIQLYTDLVAHVCGYWHKAGHDCPDQHETITPATSDLERAVLHAVLVHGRPGQTDDDVTSRVVAGSVRVTFADDVLRTGRVRVTWAELNGGAAVQAGAWSTLARLNRAIDTTRKDKA